MFKYVYEKLTGLIVVAIVGSHRENATSILAACLIVAVNATVAAIIVIELAAIAVTVVAIIINGSCC